MANPLPAAVAKGYQYLDSTQDTHSGARTSAKNLPIELNPKGPIKATLQKESPDGIENTVVTNLLLHIRIDAREYALNIPSLKYDFIFVIDISGSMKIDQKLAHVQSTMHAITEQLTENHRFSLVTFNSDVDVVTDRVLNDNDAHGLIPMTPQNRELVISEFRNIKGKPRVRPPL